MKSLFLITSIIVCSIFGNELPKNYENRYYMSIGTLPDGYRIICIDNKQYFEVTKNNKIKVTQMFNFDEEKNKKIPAECR